MAKEDEILAQLQLIMKEIQEGKKQTSAAIIADELKETKSLRVPRRRSRTFGKWSLVFILFIMISIGGFVTYYKWIGSAEPEMDQAGIIEQVKEMSSLASSQALVKAVIEKEDNQLFGKEINANIPGTKRKILLVIPGSVMAGINLDKLNDDSVTINEEEKMVELTLPRAEIIHEPSLNFEQAQTFSVEGIFRSEVNWEEAYDLAEEAKIMVQEEAIAQGLLQTAEKNAEKTFKEFFAHLGYKVTINYMD